MCFETYQVEEIDGRKVIHYNGHFWNDGEEELNDDGVPCTWRVEEGTWCGLGGRGSEVAYVDAIEGRNTAFIAEQFEFVQQYGRLLTDEEAEEGMRWWRENGTELHMDDVTVDTPCGMYWF